MEFRTGKKKALRRNGTIFLLIIVLLVGCGLPQLGKCELIFRNSTERN